MTGLNYRVVDAGGLRMRIVDHGAGPPVLLCHGFPETAYAWRHQVVALASRGYRVIAPDLRGFGGTSGPEAVEAYMLPVLVGDLISLLDVLGERSAVIVGNDWGATLAWQAALLRPDRFTAVAAIGVPVMERPPVAPTQLFPQTPQALFYTLYFQEEGVAEAELEVDVRKSLLKIYFSASGEAVAAPPDDMPPNPFAMVSREAGWLAPLPVPEEELSWLGETDLAAFADDFAKSGFRGGLNLYRNLDRNWALQAAMAGRRVELPALYMVGTRDTGLAIPGMRQMIDAQARLAPRIRPPIYLQGCGHWAPQERPAEVSAALAEFLADVTRR